MCSLSSTVLADSAPSKSAEYLCGFFCALVLAGMLSGCAGVPAKPGGLWPVTIPPQAEVGDVPFYPQEQYQCGPAALAMALTWSGLAIAPDQISAQVFTPSLRGSLQPAMIAAARRNGRLAYEIYGIEALLAEIAAGNPVIVLQNLGLSWYPLWHYAVVIGYDRNAGYIRLHSGTTANKLTAIGLFEKTWARSSRWGLLVMPPERLPATAAETAFVQAALGLEKAGQFAAAVAGYRAALARWPSNLTAAMGVGNSHYALGQLSQAADAFREATRLHPTAGAAFNNLAHVLFETGRRDEAEAAALRAVAIGGPHAHVYQQTLNQIRTGGEHR